MANKYNLPLLLICLQSITYDTDDIILLGRGPDLKKSAYQKPQRRQGNHQANAAHPFVVDQTSHLIILCQAATRLSGAFR
jgi:hypothetical protein